MWRVLQFYMYTWYKSHNDAPLGYIEDALPHFRSIQDLFLSRRATKKVNKKANALRTELVKKRMVDKGINAETWILSKTQCEMNTWQDHIRHKIDVSKEVDANFNFRKTHLMLLWVHQIHWYGAL